MPRKNPKHIQGTLAECRAIIRRQNRRRNLPMRGTHVGGGKHFVMAETWDGTGRDPRGWSVRATVVRRHRRRPTEYSVLLGDGDAVDLVGRRLGGREILDTDVVDRLPDWDDGDDLG